MVRDRRRDGDGGWEPFAGCGDDSVALEVAVVCAVIGAVMLAVACAPFPVAAAAVAAAAVALVWWAR